jgi:hexosaminidase
VKVEVSPGDFRINESTRILLDPDTAELQGIGEYLVQTMYRTTGHQLGLDRAATDTPPRNAIQLMLRRAPEDVDAERYELVVTPELVRLAAARPAGLFRGVQTLRQLLPPGAEEPAGKPGDTGVIPCIQVTDYPRYPWRGMLLDCGRHFIGKDFIKRYIDLLAYHKMNVLHWHLTEDQGWRIEIKKYPKLTQVGAWRQATRDSEQPRDADGRYGGFYTQEDVKEIVAYAKSRYVTIVPEIELPGHSQAALASYPELSCTGGPLAVGTQWGVTEDVYCAGNDKTFEFLEGVLTEVIGLFPSEYVHIGGDECPKTRWKACPKCQARIKTEGLKDEHELQSYFVRRIEKFLNSKSRRLIGWDEILEGGLAPNATVQSWRGMDGAIAGATSDHDVISSPTSHCYLDYAQGRHPGEPTNMGFLPLETVYSFEPTPAVLTPEQAVHVLGAECNLWTEHAPQPLVDRQVFPRLCALAEVAWSPREKRDWQAFQARLRTHYQRLDGLGVCYYVPPPQFVSGGEPVAEPAFTDSLEITLENTFGAGEMRFTLDGSEPTASSPRYVSPFKLTDTTVVRARTFLRTGNASGIGEMWFKKLRPHEPVRLAEAAPGLSYAYYEGTWSRLPDFTKLAPAAAGVAPLVDLCVRKRDDGFAVRFTGYVEVPADGVYTFYVLSDDGGRLRIGEEVVVDHDGLHPASELSGKVLLMRGRHPITVEYFQAGGALRLEVSYEGSGIAKQTMPAAALSHVEPQR